MRTQPQPEPAFLDQIRRAALDQTPIDGLTHRFYRYPARFSPTFARACIELFSSPGDVVLDPYMGGGTTVVEAVASGRRAIGSDINSLSVFLARVKTTVLSRRDERQIVEWAMHIVPRLRYSDPSPNSPTTSTRTPRHMTLPEVRSLRKLIELSLDAAAIHLSSGRARRFARCVLLNVGQWALNGRKSIPSAADFRDRIAATAADMLLGTNALADALAALHAKPAPPLLRHLDAEHIHNDRLVLAAGPADLVVTSPPYPGIHMLYHRWQVDGRKETDAPYWIAACNDGSGASYYNFADRRRSAQDAYFQKAQRAFAAIRRVMRPGAVLAQMIAFADPARHYPRYLSMLNSAGFQELPSNRHAPIWRQVPRRRWHANLKGELPSSREFVLLHHAC